MSTLVLAPPAQISWPRFWDSLLWVFYCSIDILLVLRGTLWHFNSTGIKNFNPDSGNNTTVSWVNWDGWILPVQELKDLFQMSCFMGKQQERKYSPRGQTHKSFFDHIYNTGGRDAFELVFGLSHLLQCCFPWIFYLVQCTLGILDCFTFSSFLAFLLLNLKSNLREWSTTKYHWD